MSKTNPSKLLSWKNNLSSRPGFTMIEVMLVLALAGLIFMGIFIALPNAQMNQRNSNRRSDYTRLSTSISNYTSDNNGRLPKLANIEPSWLNQSKQDPDGNDYPAKGAMSGCDYGAACTVTPPTATAGDQVHVYFGYVCDSTGVPTSDSGSGATARTFAIYGYIEDGSGGDTFCTQSNG